MTPTELKTWRATTGVSQSMVAEMIGLSLRQYQDIESGAAELRKLHVTALLAASLKLASVKRDLNLALPDARWLALEYASLLSGDTLPPLPESWRSAP